MVTIVFPLRVRPDLHPLHVRSPFLRDKAVVDVIRLVFLPLKVRGELLLVAVSLAKEAMVAAHQS